MPHTRYTLLDVHNECDLFSYEPGADDANGAQRLLDKVTHVAAEWAMRFRGIRYWETEVNNVSSLDDPWIERKLWFQHGEAVISIELWARPDENELTVWAYNLTTGEASVGGSGHVAHAFLRRMRSLCVRDAFASLITYEGPELTTQAVVRRCMELQARFHASGGNRAA